MLCSRQAFDRLSNFSQSAIDTFIPLARKNTQPINFLADLTHQLMQYPG
jgi:hypothetical protein